MLTSERNDGNAIIVPSTKVARRTGIKPRLTRRLESAKCTAVILATAIAAMSASADLAPSLDIS